jgi:hypothetical protein
MRLPTQKHSTGLFDGALRGPQDSENENPEIGRDQHRFRLSLLPIRQTDLIEIEDEFGWDERDPCFD